MRRAAPADYANALRNPAVALTGVFGLIAAAWAVSTPAFAAPDEWAHYLRTISISRGQILGRPTVNYADPGLSKPQLQWVVQATRIIAVPPGLSHEGYACHALNPGVSAACNNTVPPPPQDWTERIIPNGTYQPAAYFPAAAVIRLGATPVAALLLGRLASALLCAALFFLALRSLTAASPRSVLGLLVACPPMVLFLGGMLNPSGFEILGAIAFFSGLIAVARGGEATRPGWLAATAGALVVPLSRSLGGVYLPALALLWAIWVGPKKLLALIRAAPRPAFGCALAALLGLAINRGWEALYGPKVPADTHDLGPALASAVTQIPGWLQQEVGNFQYIDTPLPDFVYVAWFALGVALLATAAVVGSWADRRALFASAAMALAIPLALQVLVLRPSEWLVQGRHILAITVPLFLLAGEAVARALRQRIAVRALAAATVTIWVSAQFAGFYVNAQRSAVGIYGPGWFLPAAEWHPPLGWTLWLIVVAGALATAAGAVWSSLRQPPGAAPRVTGLGPA